MTFNLVDINITCPIPTPVVYMLLLVLCLNYFQLVNGATSRTTDSDDETDELHRDFVEEDPGYMLVGYSGLRLSHVFYLCYRTVHNSLDLAN